MLLLEWILWAVSCKERCGHKMHIITGDDNCLSAGDFCTAVPQWERSKDKDGDRQVRDAYICIEICDCRMRDSLCAAVTILFWAAAMTIYLLYYTIFGFLCQGISPKRQIYPAKNYEFEAETGDMRQIFCKLPTFFRFFTK